MDRMKRLYVSSLLFAIAIVALVLIAVFFTLYNKVYPTNAAIKAIIGNYSLTSNYCSSFSILRSIGLEKMCIQTYKLNMPSQHNAIPFLVYTFYKFNSSIYASSFVRDIGMHLNTTPWPEGTITNKSAISNYTYTTEYFPGINNYGGSMWVYTLYYVNGSKVISLSAVNSTQNMSTTLSSIVELMDYLKRNISKIN
jgi:hypothetical protein